MTYSERIENVARELNAMADDRVGVADRHASELRRLANICVQLGINLSVAGDRADDLAKSLR